MAYSPDADNGLARRWELQLTHTATGVKVACNLLPNAATEAQNDAVFQGLLDKVATLSGVTIDYARKITAYQSNVTPT